MSGQLVGEVLDASGALQASGLSERGFHALVAIAEKCHTTTRQGSVRWDHIRAGLYGASLATAKRAIKDLKTAGIIRVIKRGFNNQHGRICAPIYQIAPLPERVTQVTQSLAGANGSHEGGERVKPGGRMGQIRTRTGHPGDLLDGSIDGPIDGPLDEREPSTRGTRLPAGWKPPPELVAQMRADHPHIDLDLELEKFSDYWQDQPGAKGRKVTWTGTYRNWIRREAQQLDRRTPARTNNDDKVNGWLNLAIADTATTRIELT